MKIGFYLKQYVSILVGWAFLSSFLGFFFVLAKIDFPTAELNLFILSWWGVTIIMGIIGFLLNGGFLLLGIHRFQHDDAEVLNNLIIDGKIIENISNKELETMFFFLKREGPIGFAKSAIHGSAPPLVSCSVFYFLGMGTGDLLVILMGGIIAVSLFSPFTFFFLEVFLLRTLKECREMMYSRGIETDENIYLHSLSGKFNYFVFLFLILILIFLNFVSLDIYILIISLVSFIMVIVISRILFMSMYSVFGEIKNFGEKLSLRKKARYISGSSCKEVLDLSENLNQSAEELYKSRQELQSAYDEIKKRKDELEKFYKLTVGRELKMAELKEKIKCSKR